MNKVKTARSALSRLTVYLTSAVLLSLLESQLLWGYWFQRPSLVPRSEIESLKALSALSFNADGIPVVSSERRIRLLEAKAFCAKEVDSNECLEGAIVLALEQSGLLTDNTPEMDTALLSHVWSEVGDQLWQARIHDSQFKTTSIPVSGLGVYYSTKSREQRLLLAWRTSEISNDRYAYAEAQVELESGRFSIQRQVHFFYEIAGLEGLTWPYLATLNLIVLGFSWSAIRVVRWLPEYRIR
jgi:hypothetical protein